jgi:hypothetical protein
MLVAAEIKKVSSGGQYYIYSASKNLAVELNDFGPGDYHWFSRQASQSEVPLFLEAQGALTKAAAANQLEAQALIEATNLLTAKVEDSANGLKVHLDSDSSTTQQVDIHSPLQDVRPIEAKPTVGQRIVNFIAKSAIKQAFKVVAARIVAQIPVQVAKDLGVTAASTGAVVDGAFVFFYSSDIATEDLRALRAIQAAREADRSAALAARNGGADGRSSRGGGLGDRGTSAGSTFGSASGSSGAKAAGKPASREPVQMQAGTPLGGGSGKAVSNPPPH